ncbi:hypothetical protein H2198_003570 [Neophaeococcomyces mojaviensis]|uniref:Uncharacterized protein n=1 Tax=Neophaeococcomyces mojaviensis TaxID=3383035 RepID=A0ACC3AB32_9EURO|nr:hypothetical protein H2198_003570 [Knufia sp. JES_112]
MPRLSQLAIASALTLMVSAQASTTVTNIFIPFADQQPLDASIIAESNNVATLAVQCAPGTDSSDCGFPEPITLTVGPSTFHYSPSGVYNILGELDCKVTGTTEASCIATQGVYDTASLATATDSDWVTKPASTSTTTSGVLTGSELFFVSVTVTAGLEKATGAASEITGAGTTATGKTSGSITVSGSTTRISGGNAGSSTTGSSSSVIPSASGNVAAGVSPGMVYSGVLMALAALPMMLL